MSEQATFEKWEGTCIMLVDLDAFFASVEQLDHPEWRGKPVIVGGDPDKHGVVSTCSYEARKFGVRSAMPASTAHKLCPQAIWTHGHFSRYREMSDAIMSIIYDETPYVQQVSIDEAFADITPTRTNTEHPISIAQRVQERVSQLGVTCSIGVGVSKSVAKIASDMDKPNGLTVVYPGSERAFLRDLPIKVLSGVGPSAQAKLASKGIMTLGQMGAASPVVLEEIFGKNGQMMRERALGCDSSVVSTEREVKSVSHEQTFATNLTDRAEMIAALRGLLSKVCRRLRRKGLQANTLSIKVRFDDRSIRNSQAHLKKPSNDELELFPLLPQLLERALSPGYKVMLLGVSATGFAHAEDNQAALFDMDELAQESSNEVEKPLVEDEHLRRNLLNATDVLKDKFGEDAVVLGSEFRSKGNNTGSSSKNPADYK